MNYDHKNIQDNEVQETMTIHYTVIYLCMWSMKDNEFQGTMWQLSMYGEAYKTMNYVY